MQYSRHALPHQRVLYLTSALYPLPYMPICLPTPQVISLTQALWPFPYVFICLPTPEFILLNLSTVLFALRVSICLPTPQVILLNPSTVPFAPMCPICVPLLFPLLRLWHPHSNFKIYVINVYNIFYMSEFKQCSSLPNLFGTILISWLLSFLPHNDSLSK